MRYLEAIILKILDIHNCILVKDGTGDDTNRKTM